MCSDRWPFVAPQQQKWKLCGHNPATLISSTIFSLFHLSCALFSHKVRSEALNLCGPTVRARQVVLLLINHLALALIQTTHSDWQGRERPETIKKSIKVRDSVRPCRRKNKRLPNVMKCPMVLGEKQQTCDVSLYRWMTHWRPLKCRLSKLKEGFRYIVEMELRHFSVLNLIESLKKQHSLGSKWKQTHCFMFHRSPKWPAWGHQFSHFIMDFVWLLSTIVKFNIPSRHRYISLFSGHEPVCSESMNSWQIKIAKLTVT